MAEFIREDHISQALRWIACETYAIGMIGNWWLALLEFERDEKGELWLPKVSQFSRYRKLLYLMHRICSGHDLRLV